MRSITLHSHVGQDGILKLEVPVGLADVEMEVTVILHPVSSSSPAQPAEPHGWPPGFFERFAGCLPDFPDIEPEGDFEVREAL